MVQKKVKLLILLLLIFALPLILISAKQKQETRQQAQTAQSPVWEMIGPGDTDAIWFTTVSKGGVVYAGTDIGGAYKSLDKGQNWISINGTYPNHLKNMYVHGITVDPTNESIIWLATRGGPYKSTNGGQTWTAKRNGMPTISSTKITAAVSSIAIKENDARYIYAGIGDPRWGNGHASWWQGIGKIYKSSDGGESWSLAPTSGTIGSSTSNILWVAIDSTNNYLYAASDNGLYRSTDQGATWTQKVSGSARYVEVARSNPNYVWAVVGGGIYQSTNTGSSFTKLTMPVTSSFKWLTIGSDPNIVYASIFDNWLGEAYKTTNGTASSPSWSLVTRWKYTSSSNVAYGWRPQWKPAGSSIAIDPTNSNNVYYGSSSQIFKTDNGGSTWYQIYTKPVGAYWNNTGFSLMGATYAVTVDPRNGNNIYMGVGDHGLLRSKDQGKSWKLVSQDSQTGASYGFDLFTGSHDSRGIVVDPNDSNKVFSTNTPPGEVTKGRIVKTINALSDPPSWTITASSDTAGAFENLILDKTSPSGARVLYFTAGGKVYKSTNDGNSFSQVGDVGKYIRRLIINPTNNSILYAAATGDSTYPGGVFISANKGVNWQKINTNTLADVKGVAITSDGKTLFATVRSRGSYPGGIFKTTVTNDSSTWSQVKSDRRVEDITILPGNQVMYAVTNDDNFHDESAGSGIYRSIDGGNTWNLANDGLRMFKFSTITHDPNPPYRIYAGANGDAIYTTTDPYFGGITSTPTFTPIPTQPPTPTATATPPLLTFTPSPTPTKTPTPTFTITPTPLMGDANKDGKVDIVDFNIWRNEFLGLMTTKTADFNGNGTIDIVDFNLWRNAFLGL